MYVLSAEQCLCAAARFEQQRAEWDAQTEALTTERDSLAAALAESSCRVESLSVANRAAAQELSEVGTNCPTVYASASVSLSHYLTVSLPHCLTASLPHCLTVSLPHCLTTSLAVLHCLTASAPLPYSIAFAPLAHYLAVSLSPCLTASLSHCLTASLAHYLTGSLLCCLTT